MKFFNREITNTWGLERKFKRRFKKVLSHEEVYNIKYKNLPIRSQQSLFDMYLKGIINSDFEILHKILSSASTNKLNKNWKYYLTETGELQNYFKKGN